MTPILIKNFIKYILSILGYKFVKRVGFKIILRKKTKLEKLLENIYNPNLSFEEKKYIIEQQFEKYAGYKPNIDNPRTFNEKLQWLKLYNKQQLNIYGDKYLVRKYIKETIGEEYLVPLLGVWNTPNEIDFSKLPEQFVLKVNWGSGQNIIVKDKSKLNKREAKTKLKEWLNPKMCHYYHSFETSYKDINPKIICEKFIDSNDKNLTCYKIFNFNKKSYLIQAVFDDKTPYETINYYDLNWNKLNLRQNFPNSDIEHQKPQQLELMLELAEKLAQNFPYFVRTDFFTIDNKIYFSELTFFSDNGMAPFEPAEWDYKLGELINLPEIDKEKSNK